MSLKKIIIANTNFISASALAPFNVQCFDVETFQRRGRGKDDELAIRAEPSS